MSDTSLPEVSVIVPLYNREDLIRETVQSVLLQSVANWELIIVDDGSTDNSQRVAEQLSEQHDRIRVLSRPDHILPGGNGARNFGFGQARGKYVMWLDSDDLLTEDYLALQIGNLEAGNSDVSFCKAQMFTLVAGAGKKFGRAWCDDIVPKSTPLGCFTEGRVKWQTSTGLWRRAFFPTTEPFEERLQNGQEWLMHGTMLLHEPRIAYLSRVLVHIREHEERKSHTSKIARYNINRLLGRYLFLKKARKMGMSSYMTLHLLRKQRAYLLTVFRYGNRKQRMTALKLFAGTVGAYAGRIIS